MGAFISTLMEHHYQPQSIIAFSCASKKSFSQGGVKEHTNSLLLNMSLSFLIMWQPAAEFFSTKMIFSSVVVNKRHCAVAPASHYALFGCLISGRQRGEEEKCKQNHIMLRNQKSPRHSSAFLWYCVMGTF